MNRSFIALAAAATLCAASACSGSSPASPGCAWQLVAAYALDTQPPSEIGPKAGPSRGGPPGQGAETVWGRHAWKQSADWAYLFAPSGLTSIDDVFAVQADIFIPDPDSEITVRAGIQVLTYATTVDTNPSTGGAMPEMSLGYATTTLQWYRSNLDGTSDHGGARTIQRRLGGAWRTMRVEGIRSAPHLEFYLDGEKVGSWTSDFDLTGSYMALFSGRYPSMSLAEVGWSNLRIYRGTNCAP